MDPGTSMINPEDILGCAGSRDEFSSGEEDDDEAYEKQKEKEIKDSLKGAFDDLIDGDDDDGDDEEEDEQSVPSKGGESGHVDELGNNINGEMRNKHLEHARSFPFFTSTPKYETQSKKVRFQENLNEINMIPNMKQLLDNSTGEISQEGVPSFLIPQTVQVDEANDRTDAPIEAHKQPAISENGTVYSSWVSTQRPAPYHNNGKNIERVSQEDHPHQLPFHPVHNNWVQETNCPITPEASSVTSRNDRPFQNTYSVHNSVSGDANRNAQLASHSNGDNDPVPSDTKSFGTIVIQCNIKDILNTFVRQTF